MNTFLQDPDLSFFWNSRGGHADGRDLGKVRLNGCWSASGVQRFFLVAPQCPEAIGDPGGRGFGGLGVGGLRVGGLGFQKGLSPSSALFTPFWLGGFPH